MKPYKPSTTAQFVVTAKAFEEIFSEARILKDAYAKFFVSPFVLFSSKLFFTRPIIRFLIRNRISGMYYCITRAKFIDDFIQRKIKEGVYQIVIMGAGYDTTAIRYRDTKYPVRFFELDYPMTQERKLRLIRRNSLTPHKSTHFISHDFITMDLQLSLKTNDFNFSEPTLFVFSGISMYLQRRYNEEILKTIAMQMRSRRSVVFDVALPFDPRGEDYKSAFLTFERNKRYGEPFLWVPSVDEIVGVLTQTGYENIKTYNAKQLHEEYYKGLNNIQIASNYLLITADVGKS